MKTKLNGKKLSLNKNTISALNNVNMEDIKGGTATFTCDTCLTPAGGTHCIACYENYTTYGPGVCC